MTLFLVDVMTLIQPLPSPSSSRTLTTHFLSSFVRQLKDAVEEVDLTSDQRVRMNEFFSVKALLGSEMCDEDFEKICELGAGNGGVVSKVRHLKSGIIMARKVSYGRLYCVANANYRAHIDYCVASANYLG